MGQNVKKENERERKKKNISTDVLFKDRSQFLTKIIQFHP